MILAGDIGGTNSRLALYSAEGGLTCVREQSFKNASHAGLVDVVREFLAAEKEASVDRACFAVAGPVMNGRVNLTNLAWPMLDESSLSKDLGIPRVALINDMHGHAEGINVLAADQIVTIAPGVKRDGNRAIIAAGTGLGEGGVVYDARRKHYVSFPCEGGHADFGPRTEIEAELLKWVRPRIPHGHVSWEAIVSGPGIRRIYDFFVERLGGGGLPGIDPSPSDIAAAGVKQASQAAAATVRLFVQLYGSEAANLAVKTLAVGGVYIGGGIATGMLELIRGELFLERFYATGHPNVQRVLREMPIHVVTYGNNALLGAAFYASKL